MEVDRADIQAAAGGDRAAFERLVRACQAAVVAYALHLTGSLPDAEDVAQESLVTAWLRLGDLRDASRFEPWLRRIVERQSLTWRRRQRPTTPLADEPADPVSDARTAFERRALSDAVRAALATLSEKLREAVVLHYLGGLTQGQVARFLGVTEGAVAVRLHRARERLRGELAGLGEELRASRPAEEFTRMVMAQVIHAVSTVDEHLLVLRDGRERTFRIHTTRDQVRAVRRALLGAERFPRPEPHELLLAALRAYDIEVVEARLDRVEDSIFKARLCLARAGQPVELDCRATDAIVVALLAGAPVQADDQVVEGAMYRDGEGRPLSPEEVEQRLAEQGLAVAGADGLVRGLLDRRPDGRWTVLLDSETLELACPAGMVPDDAPDSCPVWVALTTGGKEPAIEDVALYEVAGRVVAEGDGGVFEAELGRGETIRLTYPPAVHERRWRQAGPTTAWLAPDPAGGWRLVLELGSWRGRATAPVERCFDFLVLSGERMDLAAIRLVDEGARVLATGVREGVELELQTLPGDLGRRVIEHFRTVYGLPEPEEGEETVGTGMRVLFGKGYDLTLRLREEGGRQRLAVDHVARPQAGKRPLR